MTTHAPHGPPRSFRQDWAAWSIRARIIIPLAALALAVLSGAVLWARYPWP